MCKNERGSSMLMVLLAIVLFSVLGLAIMGMSLNTAKLTEVRETDVQYIHLAEKELDRLVAEIYAQFDGFIVDDGTDIQTMITNQIDMLEDNIGSAITATAGGVVDPCGTTITPSIQNTNWSGNDLQITLKAIVSTDTNAPPDLCAKINRTLEQIITLSKVPDALQYALGTEGKLTMNGAPYIIGDIYAGQNLYISEDAEYNLENLKKQKDTRPQRPILRGVENPTNEDEKRKMYSNLFIQDGSENDGKILRKESGTTNWSDFFSVTNKYKNKEIKEIEGKAVFSEGAHPNFINVPNHDGKVFPIYRGYTKFTALDWDNDIWNPRWQPNGALPFHTLNPDPDTLLVGETHLDIDGIKNGQRYIYEGAGPLNINYTMLDDYYGSSKNLSCVDCNSTDPGAWILVRDQNVRIEGPEPSALGICSASLEIDKVHFAIKGNLEISGCIKMNSAIYVNGHPVEPWVTEIGDAYLEGIADQALVLFSKPPIKITRVNTFEETTTELYPDTGSSNKVLRGFFYTEGTDAWSIGVDGDPVKNDESTLYGVGSRLWIKGGFFSKKDLTLNAYRGDVKLVDPANDDFSFYPNPNQGASRLVVEYDKNSIESHNNSNTLPNTNTAYIMVEIGSRQLK